MYVSNPYLGVFNETLVAVEIKKTLHNSVFKSSVLKVYFAQHTDLSSIDSENKTISLDLLKVPELERNFLLSPPGSPHIGWTQTMEAGPVKGGFSEDVIEHAFSMLAMNNFANFSLDDNSETLKQVQNYSLDKVENTAEEDCDLGIDRKNSGSCILKFQSLSLQELPTIIIEFSPGNTSKNEIPKTTLPPKFI